MQIFAHRSDEGTLAGLGWIPGEVIHFKSPKHPNLILPHMGWNDVRPLANQGLFKNLSVDAEFYFLHSF